MFFQHYTNLIFLFDFFFYIWISTFNILRMLKYPFSWLEHDLNVKKT